MLMAHFQKNYRQITIVRGKKSVNTLKNVVFDIWITMFQIYQKRNCKPLWRIYKLTAISCCLYYLHHLKTLRSRRKHFICIWLFLRINRNNQSKQKNLSNRWLSIWDCLGGIRSWWRWWRYFLGVTRCQSGFFWNVNAKCWTQKNPTNQHRVPTKKWRRKDEETHVF